MNITALKQSSGRSMGKCVLNYTFSVVWISQCVTFIDCVPILTYGFSGEK